MNRHPPPPFKWGVTGIGICNSQPPFLPHWSTPLFGVLVSQASMSFAGTKIPEAICAAFRLNTAVPDAVKQERGIILFVVQPGERNIADQRLLEVQIWEQSNLVSMRLSLKEIQEQGSLDEGRNLVIDGKVVCFQANFPHLLMPLWFFPTSS